MEFRRLRSDDCRAVAEFAVEGMRPHLYPLHVCMPKVVATVQHFERSQSDFHLVAFDAGRVVGAIAAAVTELLFFERREAHVLMCRATAPGAGGRLLSALRTWIDREPLVRRVQFPTEFDASPAMARLLHRYGFKHRITTCVYYKE